MRLPQIVTQIHSLDQWRAVYPLLREHPRLAFSDGLPQQCPSTIEEMFRVLPMPLGRRPVLRLIIGRASLIIHYRLSEIRCSVDPPQDLSESDAEALLTFMRQVGDRLGTSVAASSGGEASLFGEGTFVAYDPQTKDFHSWEEL
jgi:hypothetical protein